MNCQYKMFRVKGYSWWEQELPSQKEMDNGWKNLAENGFKVDYILSHTPDTTTVTLACMGNNKGDVLTDYLTEVRAKTDFKRHFCGHMHIDRACYDKTELLYYDIKRIA